jgi:zeaxanthin glucosyltransferase
LRELKIMKIGFLSMPLTGHTSNDGFGPQDAGARARGNIFGLPDAARIVHSAGLDFVPFGEEEYPVGTTPAMYAHLARLKGEDVVRYSFQEMHPLRARITLEQLPEKLVRRGVEALVLDTIHFFAELVP